MSALFDRIYSGAGGAPWSFAEPPAELVDLVESGEVRPGRALDVGCGEGSHSIYLASQGFDVTGVDISGVAVAATERRAPGAGRACRFLRMDWSDLAGLGRFDFVLDWRLLHEILDEEQRRRYIDLVASLLARNGKYLSVAFGDVTEIPGNGRIRTTPVGTTLLFASQTELAALYRTRFDILDERVIPLRHRVPGGETNLTAYFFLLGAR